MNLLKTSFWSAVATTVKILAGIITTKIMAVLVGPTGIALFGNFTNIIGILSSFANGSIGPGITKYISEFESKDEKQYVVSHAVKISLVCSCIIGIIVLIFHNELTNLAFGDTKYSIVFVLLGFTITFFGLNITITSVLNGYRYIKLMIITGIIGSIISVILAIIITIKFGILGALINSSIAQVCIFIINMWFIRKLKFFNYKMFLNSIDLLLLRKLFKYGAMGFITTLVVPTSTFIIRKYIFNNFSANEAGYVQGVWSISNAYLMIVTTTLSIYYLPTLSSIKDEAGLRKEIFKGYKFLLPVAIIGGMGIYLCRDLIIYIMYTPEFLPMKRYFTFQIIGDTLKIASWILAYLMVAKAMTRWFIITEIIFAGINVASSFLFMSLYGSIGVTYGYVLNYLLYLIFMIVLFRKFLFKSKSIIT